MKEKYENLNDDYCSRVAAGSRCICRVGNGYPKVPKFDLVCTRSSKDGCLGSANLGVIPSTNSYREKKKTTPTPIPTPIPIPIGEAIPTPEQMRELRANAAERRRNTYQESGVSNAAASTCEETKTSAAVLMKSLDVMAEADFSNDRKMYETWKIPPSLLPCKEYITNILAAIPNGTSSGGSQGTGKIVQKKWNKPAGDPDNLINQIIKQGFSGVKENDIRQCNALVVVLGQNLDFSNPTAISADSAPDNWTRSMDLEIAGNKKQSYAVRLYSEDYGSYSGFIVGGHRDVYVGVNRRRTTGLQSDRSSTLVDLENIKVRQNNCVTSGGKLTVTSTKANPKGPDLKVENWEARFGGDTLPALIFVPGIDIVNPTNDYDSLILSMENVPSYGMPSWINKNEELLKKNGFADPLLSWMKVVIFNLSFRYLPTSQFQSLFTDPIEYGEVINFYMGNYTAKSSDDIGPQLPPGYFEALQKQRDAQEKIDQKYLKKDDKGNWVIPWDILEKIKDTDCDGDECYADQNYVSGRLPSENCALCSYITPMLALAALQTRKSTMSDGELRRRLQEVDYADSYMYVTKIHTLDTPAVTAPPAQSLETVFYGESGPASDARLQTLLSESGRWGDFLRERGGVKKNINRLMGSIKTPGASVDSRVVHWALPWVKGSWLNTIVRFGMYLSRPTSFDEMKDPQNCISKYAILNNSIPKNRTDNNYEMREPPAAFDLFDNPLRGVLPNMISQYLPGPVGVQNMCPPYDSVPTTPTISDLLMWKDYTSESNFELVIKKLEGVPFPNGECWAPLPGDNGVGPALADYIRFPRGGVNQVGMTNIRDYTQGGGSGVNDGDSEANPPLIWDKCCAKSCYKPCSDAEKEDGCVTGTWPATFFPRFKFTDVEVATSLGLKRAYFSEHILKLIKNMKANNEVYLANITCDPYFLRAIRRIDFTGLWTNKRLEATGSVPLSYTRDFQSPSGDTLKGMLSPVVDAMEYKTYYMAPRPSGVPETFPVIRRTAESGRSIYVSVYKAVRDQVMQKQGTFGPFKVVDTLYQMNRDNRVVLQSNDIFGDGDNNLQSHRKYFMHYGIQIAPSIELGELKRQYPQLTSKVMPVSQPCTIVGFKFSRVNYELTTGGAETPNVIGNLVGDPYFQTPARFNNDADKANVNYFILDIGLSDSFQAPYNWRDMNAVRQTIQAEFLRSAYILMPMPSKYESILSVFEDPNPSVSTTSWIAGWLKSWLAEDKVESKSGFPIKKFFKSIFTFSEFDPGSQTPKPAYSVSAITSIIRAKLNVDGGPNSGQAVEETDTGGGQADLQPSQAITNGSDPVWPLFLAVALCIGVILLRKMMGRKK